MRRIKRVLAVPIILILDLLKIVINLLIKAECWVAGVGFLLLAVIAFLALVNQMWLQLGIFGLIFVVCFLILLFSVQIEVWLDDLQERMMSF